MSGTDIFGASVLIDEALGSAKRMKYSKINLYFSHKRL